MILELVKEVMQMGAPAAGAIVGIGAAIAVPIVVRRFSRRAERIEELKLQRAIQLEAFKKGALTYMQEHDE